MPARESGDRSSVLRKRTLRRLCREQHAAYSELYEQVLAEMPGLSGHQARGRALTRLRHQFPDRYLELLASEQAGAGTGVPPGIRTKSWQRATARLADLHKDDYRSGYERFRAQGMTVARAYDRAAAAVRASDPEVFARLLAEEYRLWLAVSGAPASAGVPAGPLITTVEEEQVVMAARTTTARRVVPAEPLLTRSEVAALFGVVPQTVTGWAQSGRLNCIRTLGGHRRYPESEVMNLLAATRPARMPGTRPAAAGTGGAG